MLHCYFTKRSEYVLFHCWHEGIKRRPHAGRQSKTQCGKGSSFPTDWRLKLQNRLHLAWNMRSFWNKRGREGEAIIFVTQSDFRLRNPSIQPQPMLCMIGSSFKSNLRMNSTFPAPLQPPPPLFFFYSGWEYWGKVHWPLSGNQLIFIQAGGEEWEECIDVWKQTTALCVPERPDMRWNEPWDKSAARNMATPHTRIM